MTKNILLENDDLKAGFHPETGALVDLVDKTTGWRIHGREELGLSFHMLAPLPERRANRIDGRGQKLARVERGADGQSVVLVWEQLASAHGGVLDITFTGRVSLTEEGLVFQGEVENRSALTVEYVGWPCVGDLTVPAGAARLMRYNLGGNDLHKLELYPQFNSERAYWGTDHPIQMPDMPNSPFLLIDAGSHGLYTGWHDTELRNLMLYVFELKPGHDHTEAVSRGKVPTRREIAGEPVRIEYSPCHFLFAAPGSHVALGRLVLRSYRGTWHKGADLYRGWRERHLTVARSPAWAKDVHSWHQVRVNSPEDDLRYPYAELVSLAKDCKRHGVDAIQVTGWNRGGQDRGNPSHDTDPRMGTWQELREAIVKCHALGVKIVLFNKYTWSDWAEDWYRKELHRFAAKDPHGDPYVTNGYQYETLTQLANINTRRLVAMCHGSAEWRQICVREFQKSLALGAAGILYDEGQLHGPAAYCFDPNHGHPVPAFNYGFDRTLADAFREVTERQDPDFLLSVESPYDFLTQAYGFGYVRIFPWHTPAQRYVNPDIELMAAVTGYNDRTVINQCLMYRYILSYEPRMFKGRLDEFPETLAYGKRMDALRRRHREALWNVDVRHTVGATVRTDAGLDYEGYSVLKSRSSGKVAVVVANFGNEGPVTVSVALESGAHAFTRVSPEEPDPCRCDGPVTVPALSAVVLMER